MSATILKERVAAEIVNLLTDNAAKLLNLRHQPALTAMSNNVAVGVLPAVTAEQLGLQAAELNAERRALLMVAQVLEQQHQALVAPEEKPDALVQPNGNGAAEPKVEPIYG